jgi:hypothetical protein
MVDKCVDWVNDQGARLPVAEHDKHVNFIDNALTHVSLEHCRQHNAKVVRYGPHESHQLSPVDTNSVRHFTRRFTEN